ncbi:MAG: hypothetical protein M1835_003535 [Candelina submexicana]|nr:MAG: hypothetical protein M1835_003535 [Candelina submexicana]
MEITEDIKIKVVKISTFKKKNTKLPYSSSDGHPRLAPRALDRPRIRRGPYQRPREIHRTAPGEGGPKIRPNECADRIPIWAAKNELAKPPGWEGVTPQELGLMRNLTRFVKDGELLKTMKSALYLKPPNWVGKAAGELGDMHTWLISYRNYKEQMGETEVIF